MRDEFTIYSNGVHAGFMLGVRFVEMLNNLPQDSTLRSERFRGFLNDIARADKPVFEQAADLNLWNLLPDWERFGEAARTETNGVMRTAAKVVHERCKLES